MYDISTSHDQAGENGKATSRFKICITEYAVYSTWLDAADEHSAMEEARRQWDQIGRKAFKLENCEIDCVECVS